MKSIGIKSLLVVLGIGLLSQFAEAQVVFPQFADGKASDGTSYKSTFIVESTDTKDETCTLHVYGPDSLQLADGGGSVLTGDTSVGPYASFSFTLKSLGFEVLRSLGTANSLHTGFGTLSCTGTGWNAFEVFSYYDPSGNKLSEATVFASPVETPGNSSTSQIFVDQREGAQLGMAILNSSDTNFGDYNVVVKDMTGKTIGTLGLSLGPDTDSSMFLNQMAPIGGFSVPANFVGQVTITPTKGATGMPVYALGLRYTGAVFTTVPVSKCVGTSCSQ